MVDQHEMAFAILEWIGILILPAFYVGLYFAIIWADRREAIADTHAQRGDVKQAPSLMSGGGAKQSPEPIVGTP